MVGLWSNRRSVIIGPVNRIIMVLILPVDNLAFCLQLGLIVRSLNCAVANVLSGVRLPVRIHPLPIIKTPHPVCIHGRPNVVGSQVIRLIVYESDVFVAVPNVRVGNYSLLCHYYWLLRLRFRCKRHSSSTRPARETWRARYKSQCRNRQNIFIVCFHSILRSMRGLTGRYILISHMLCQTQ